MANSEQTDSPRIGLDLPAKTGMSVEDVQTPALIIDLDLFEQNVNRMREYAGQAGIHLRAHSKTHKSVDIARYQINQGGAIGICCQKVSEAEVMVNGGIKDILVSNQVTDPYKIRCLAKLCRRARILVCVDDIANIAELSKAACEFATVIECLVEINCGADRCGVDPGEPAVELAEAIAHLPGLKFTGLQAYQGAAQHIVDFVQRKASIDRAVEMVSRTLQLLASAGIECEIVSGAGTGSYPFETESGVYTELQCGSYIFMDGHYKTIQDRDRVPVSEFRNALFVVTSIISVAAEGRAICDAGLKAHSIDSGMPQIRGRNELQYIKATDEHGVIADQENCLSLNDRLVLIPGHCDPTCNLYDWYAGVRNGKVETLWPVSARGRLL